MPRKRMIDPGTWTSEDFGTLSDLAQVYFIGLISNADDEGRLKASAAFLKATVRPYKEDTFAEVDAVLGEIVDRDMVRLYEVDGTRYAYLPKWLAYQKISHPSKSKMPEPPEVSAKPPESSRALANVPSQCSSGLEESREPVHGTGEGGSSSCGDQAGDAGNGVLSNEDLNASRALMRRILKTAGTTLSVQQHHLTELHAFRQMLSDDEIAEAVSGGAEWIRENTGMAPWKGIRGVIRTRIRDGPGERSDAGESQSGSDGWVVHQNRAKTHWNYITYDSNSESA